MDEICIVRREWKDLALIIIQLGEHKVINLREYSEALKSYQPGDKVDLVYLYQVRIMFKPIGYKPPCTLSGDKQAPCSHKPNKPIINPINFS